MERRNRSRHGPICQYCKNNQVNDGTHSATALHQFNYLLKTWNADRKSLVKNRHGVEITISIKNGRPLNHDIKNGRHSLKMTPNDLVAQGNKINFRCAVSNKRASSIYLTYGNVLFRHTWFSFHDPNNNQRVPNRIEIQPGLTHAFIVRFECGDSVVVGSYNIPVCFSFETLGIRKQTFHIIRAINISLAEDLSANVESTESPFTGNSWNKEVKILPPTCSMRYSNMYTIPQEYKRCIYHNLEEFRDMAPEDYAILTDLRLQMDPGNVTENNYNKFWDITLWIEEISQKYGLQQYNMENVKLTLMECDYLKLEIPGLAEKRPSVVVGDMIDIRLHDDHTGYRGIIKKVNDIETTVEIGDLDPELICIIENGPEYSEVLDVRFVLSRLALERQHKGVMYVVKNNFTPYLFPPEEVIYKIRNTSRTVGDEEFFNPAVAHNLEQKTAVLKILNTASTPYPYIVFGPPGTGKTVTIVEAILQIKKKTTHNILICAPSNAACNVITEKLLDHCTKDELLRILSRNVEISTIHKEILPYTNYEGDGQFRPILPDIVSDYRIVVTTLILAGKFLGKYHPNVLFIDEASQACEPEVCCALGLMERGRQVILCGDPKQLGPSLSSDLAKKYGLGTSLLERLMECNLYNRNDTNYITMLKQNFRSHRTILGVPNNLFYENQLEARSARSDLDPIANIFVFEKIQELYRKQRNNRKKPVGEPIEFCSVFSQESKEGKSPSYYNMVEIQMTFRYIQALLALEFDDEENKVLQSDIGVVTMYARQVHKLKRLLQQKGFPDVEVGTTETFQGREKRIIIISTVRAKDNLLLEDKQYNLGFVSDYKRFNVALTRAMSKLIVIGCPHVLATDDKWLTYIELCKSLKAFCGVPFTARDDDLITDVTRRIINIKLDTQFNHNN